MDAETIRALAKDCGFAAAGAVPAGPVGEFVSYRAWVEAGYAGSMAYLTGHRCAVRADTRNLLASARSVIVVAKLYNGPEVHSTEFGERGHGWISRYAWGADYHAVMRRDLERLAGLVGSRVHGSFEWRAAVDTAPLMERALARRAGVGWIGKNSCLINQRLGSWLLLGELLVSIDVEPGEPSVERCGTCRRCVEACPTRAILPAPGCEGSRWTVDARLCVAYLTIELRGTIPEALRAGVGNHIFGCDICQDVCPWNRRAPFERDQRFRPRRFAPALEEVASLTAQDFRDGFDGTPVARARYQGLLRNAAVAMGNSGDVRFRAPLERLAASVLPEVAEHSRWALERLNA